MHFIMKTNCIKRNFQSATLEHWNNVQTERKNTTNLQWHKTWTDARTNEHTDVTENKHSTEWWKQTQSWLIVAGSRSLVRKHGKFTRKIYQNKTGANAYLNRLWSPVTLLAWVASPSATLVQRCTQTKLHKASHSRVQGKLLMFSCTRLF